MLLISYSLDKYDSIAPSKKIRPPTITITDEKSTVIVCYKTQKIAKLDFFFSVVVLFYVTIYAW